MSQVVDSDLNPKEFVAGIVMAATWYFGGPLGIIPTVWFAYVIADARPDLLDKGRRLLPAPAQRYLTDARDQLVHRMPALSRVLPASKAPLLLTGPTEDDAEPADAPASRPTAAPRSAAAQGQPERRGVATAERPRWVEVVNDHPDSHPHALIIGGTGAGKTTMAKAIMGDRGGRVVVLAPKISSKGWKGCGAEIVSLDRDATYAPITRALQDIDEEKRRRSRLLQDEDDPQLEPLTIVLDDIQDMVIKEPAAGELMVNLSSIGRELNMRLIGIGTTDDALNTRGWKASRNNYVRIETDATRRGTLNDGVRTVNIRADESLRLSEGVTLRPWRGEPEPTHAPVTTTTTNLARQAAPDDLLAGMLAAPLPAAQAALATVSAERAARLQAILAAQAQQPAQSVTVDRADGGPVVVNVIQAVATNARPPKDEARKRALCNYYRDMGAAGVPFDEVFAEHKGTKGDVFPAWQEGKKLHNESKSHSEAS